MESTSRQAPAGGRDVPLTVGVVGLGTMGGAMARHLLAAGYQVVGYDVDPGPMGAFREAGGMPAADPADVSRRSDAVVLSLPSENAFDLVVGGPGGLASAGQGGASTVIETSTLSLEAKERGRALLDAVSVDLLDCPISGTGAQMAAGDAVFYLSGRKEAASVAETILADCGRAVFLLGAFGNGTRLKLVANHLVTIHNASAAEALVLAERGGLDPSVALPALVAGAGSARMLEVRGPMMVAGEFEPPTMRVRTFMKDIGIIRRFAEQAGCVLPVFEAAADLHERALEAGWQDADPASVHAVVERHPPT